MNKELHTLLTAVMYYTRIPCPKWVGHDQHLLNAATRYLPLMGWIVGGVIAIIIIMSTAIFPAHVSVILGITAGILLTGGFHEDGFADVCDGFGGGWSKEKILHIMKDSRLGTFGALGLILIITLKIMVLQELVLSVDNFLFIAVVLSSHAWSRLMAVLIIFLQPYAREHDADGKAKPLAQGISSFEMTLATIFGCLPLGLLLSQSWHYIIIPVLTLASTFLLMRYFKKWIGGYTGDCLGATQQLNEAIVLLSTLSLWRFA